jgi:hypothetical protein
VAQRWAALGDEVRRRLGAAAPLEPASRADHEARLGQDLSGAMVHASPFGGQVARALGAEALTVGDRVVGGPAELNPGTRGGAALLGHELTHAAQHGAEAGGGPPIQRTADPDANEETIARAVETEVLGDGSPRKVRRTVDPEKLAERVYRKILDEIRLENERLALLDGYRRVGW